MEPELTTTEGAPPTEGALNAEPTDQGSFVQSEGGNVAWKPFLDVLPTSLHPTVTPVLQDWDKGVNERFREIHSQYEPYKAYQPLIDNEVPLESIEYALGLMQQLNESPRAIYDALLATFGEEWGLNGEAPVADLGYTDQQFGEGDSNDPRVAQLEEGFKQLAGLILGERQEADQQLQIQQADSELDTTLNDLKSRHGDFNERVVLGLMLSGLSGDEAVAEYKSDVNSALEASRRPPAPGIISQGGVVAPSQDVRKLDGKDTRALVAQFLQQANQTQ